MLPLAVTMGDPAGVGGEIMLKAWLAQQHAFVALDDPARLGALASHLGLAVPIRQIEVPAEASCFADALPVLCVPLAVPARAGHPDPANAGAVTRSIERAVALALAGAVGGVVTNPISKAVLYAAGFPHPGHTEFLGVLTGAVPVMMLASPMLRVVPVTVHVSLQQALQSLTTERIVAVSRITASALARDFGVKRPRLAIAGLNPHAGEGGALGVEEANLISPAMAILRNDGVDVSGPWPPDTMFTPAARARYDAAICMYHDQALIPLKTLDMAHGVNVTLGLPIIRTSPDHGTAFDIAGTGQADPASLLAALNLAADISEYRNKTE
jgi:4-hydroxythreonine-4-phosphate dehydrogenase